MEIRTIIENRFWFKWRVVCFFLSLIIHAAGITLLFSIRFDYKLFPETEDIRKVFVVPPDKIFVLKNIGNYSQNQEQEFYSEETSISEKSGSREKAGEDTSPFPRSITQTDSDLEGENRTDATIQAKDLTINPELAARFRLDKSQDTIPDPVLFPKKENNPYKERIREQSGREPDFTKYLYPGQIKTSSSNRMLSSGIPGKGKRRRRKIISPALKNYDLSPWADKTVNMIQKNWDIPITENTDTKGSVGISVTITKNGELFSIEVIDSSKNDLLDQAAIRALNLSSPFPSLPDDFPEQILEIFLVFKYDD